MLASISNARIGGSYSRDAIAEADIGILLQALGERDAALEGSQTAALKLEEAHRLRNFSDKIVLAQHQRQLAAVTAERDEIRLQCKFLDELWTEARREADQRADAMEQLDDAVESLRKERPEVGEIRQVHAAANPQQPQHGWQFAYDSIERLLSAITDLEREVARGRNATHVGMLRAEDAEDLTRDLQQYHDWAEPQVQRLGREIVARESAESRARELQGLLERFVSIPNGMSARHCGLHMVHAVQIDAEFVKEVNAALAQSQAEQADTVEAFNRCYEQNSLRRGQYDKE